MREGPLGPSLFVIHGLDMEMDAQTAQTITDEIMDRRELVRLSDLQEHGPKAGKLPVPRRGTSAWRILNAVAAAAAQDGGLTDDGICDQLNIHGRGVESGERKSRFPLVQQGWIVDAGITKTTPVGGKSIVWFLSDAGAAQFGLPRGWKAKRRPKKRAAVKQVMSVEEQQRRREQQAIDQARGLAGSDKKLLSFVGYAQRLQRETKTFEDLRILATSQHCRPHEREILLMFARHIHDVTGKVIDALERNEPLETGYYDLLGVGHRATEKQITTAYRKLAKLHHPDVNPDSKELFKDITAAYDVLSDPDKRILYNLYGPALEARRS